MQQPLLFDNSETETDEDVWDPNSDTDTDVDVYDGPPLPPPSSSEPTRFQRFVRCVLEALEASEFDPKYAVEWKLGEAICQKNCLEGISGFLDCFLLLAGSTQVGKSATMSHLETKAALLDFLPPVHLTFNLKSEIERFKRTFDKYNLIVDARAKEVLQLNPGFEGMVFPKIEVYDDVNEYGRALPPLGMMQSGEVSTIPVLSLLANPTAEKKLMTAGRFLCEKGYVCDDSVINGRRVGKRLRAHLVIDEADLTVNSEVDEEETHLKKLSKLLYTKDRVIVGGSESVQGTFFDLFTCVTTTSATLTSLFYCKLKLRKRETTRFVQVTPSKYGHQFDPLPEWGCNAVKRQVTHNGPEDMYEDMVEDKHRYRHAIVIDKKKTTVKVDQRLEATKCAAKYPGLLSCCVSADGISVFVRVDGLLGEVAKKMFNPSSEHDTAAGSGQKDLSEKNHVLFFYKGNFETRNSLSALLQADVDREQKEHAKKKKRHDKGGVSEEEFLEIKTLSVRMEEVLASPTTVGVMEYSDKREKYGNYPTYIARAYYWMDLIGKEELLKTVVFGRGVIDRGVNMTGKNHEGPPTDEYIDVDHHYAGMIHSAGRICGNNYHDCTSTCPSVQTAVRYTS